jgi:hypothetical protein
MEPSLNHGVLDLGTFIPGPIHPSSERSCDGTGLLAVNAVEVLRRMPGGSQTCLMRCDDTQLYIVKLKCNPQGNGTLGNELISARLLKAVGLPTPEYKAVFVSEAFLAANPSLYFETETGRVSTSSGFHFGSHFLAQDDSCELYSILPNSYHALIENRNVLLGCYIFDIWANHGDARQFVFRRKLGERALSAFVIDNGHMFGGPSWTQRQRPGVAMCLDRRLYGKEWEMHAIAEWCAHFETVLPNILPKVVSNIPDEWYNGKITVLSDFLESRFGHLHRLFMSELTQNPRIRGHYGANHDDKIHIYNVGVSPLRDRH